jgi:hypothetical protein
MQLEGPVSATLEGVGRAQRNGVDGVRDRRPGTGEERVNGVKGGLEEDKG